MGKNSLKFTLIVWSLGILVALTFLTSGTAYFFGSQKVTEHYQDQMKTVVKIVAYDFDNSLRSHANLAETIAHDPRTIESIRTRGPAASRFYAEILKRYGSYENVFVYPSNETESSPVVAEALEGKTIGYGSTPEQKQDLQNFLQASSKETVAMSKAKKSPITGSTVAVLSTAVRDQGRIIGVVCIALSLDTISDQLVSNAKLGKEGYVAVVEQEGNVIAHKNKSLILNLDIAKQSFGKELMALRNGQIFRFFFAGQNRFATVQRLDHWKLNVAAIQPINEISDSLNELILGILVVSVLIAFVSGSFLYRLVSKRLRPLESASRVLKEMSDGNLTNQLNAAYHDEIGGMSKDMNSFIETLSGSIRNVQKIATDLSDSSNQLSSSSQSFAGVAQATAASSEQMSATTEEMAAGMEQITDRITRQFQNIKLFHSKIKELSIGARRIGSEIQNTVQRNATINDDAKQGEESLASMQLRLDEVLKSSEQMTGIITLVNEISDQTRLLALNAAIEAARAGQAGKGFAVVADEISKLSDKTTSSIQSISQILGKNKEELDQGAQALQVSAETIQKIIRNVEAASEGMRELLAITEAQELLNEDVDRQSDTIGAEAESVKIAIEEQKRAVREIAEAVSQWNEQAMGTATSSEDVSSTSVQLSANAERLKRIAEQFKIR
ncbi:methyl-accepting chemotaxis protein [Leptospira yasudae]|uniref:methyl-accepting chemotaxis protein n=1 Tax=Leptospira yasudae TaxID=2202201 RepID=UPI0010834653|nr:methyl-accepting chemotaxis protein [Leptospira yasudae]TGK24615.1 methyl-accepting chemotaxis protein [Leptospira yasudae]TGM05598.1 methyl-accepting chemotaxis protein [Leptospira yasudae]